MDDLKFVAFRQWRLRPLIARSDRSIVFDGDTIELEPELTNQVFQAGRFGQRREDAGLTIQDNGERHVSSVAGMIPQTSDGRSSCRAVDTDCLLHDPVGDGMAMCRDHSIFLEELSAETH